MPPAPRPNSGPIPGDPFLRPSLDRAASVAGALPLESIAHHGVQWLWPRRVPIGKVTLLVGDPGLGKSLVALDIAARVSTGAPWPDEAPRSQNSTLPTPDSELSLSTTPLPPEPRTLNLPASVLLLSAEDDLADTIRPRLDAAGADCSRIMVIPSFLGSSCDGAVPREHELRRDLARLRTLIEAMNNCRLIIIDPISAYLRGSANSVTEVRSLLVPLAQLAQERGVAIVAVSHLRKQDGAALHRTMGSLAFVAAARAAWVICADPTCSGTTSPGPTYSAQPSPFPMSQDGAMAAPLGADLTSQELTRSERRLMLPMKSNLAARTTGLAFTVESKSVPRAESTAQSASYDSPESDAPPIIRWSAEPVRLTADEGLSGRLRSMGRPSTDREDAARWLRTAMAVGLRAASDVEDDALANGFRLHTLRRAFRDLGGEATRIGFGPLGQWFWKLPSIDGQKSKSI
ncbi:MAG TPA: AAA family ATPase [Pirellulaceae bacterium]|jgi:hypothetical protein